MPETAGVNYPHAPIAEAVLDIRVDELEPAVLARIRSYTDVEYPNQEEGVLSGIEIEHSPLGMSTRSSHKMDGYRFTSEDGKQIVQMRSDGFTFSRLAPYEDWQAFYSESRRLWQSYVQLTGKVHLRRGSLRYINLIDVPSGQVKIDDYLRTRPEISPDMPDVTSGYFMFLNVPLPDYGADSQIVQTVLAREEGNEGSLVLDIEVFCPLGRTEIMDPIEMEELDVTFSKLRKAKNLVFEASITDQSRRLFR